MTTTVHVAVYDGLSDWEVGLATAHIANGWWQREPGRAEVRTVGASPAPITTMGGMRVVPDLALDGLEPADSAMLILPGGDGWEAGQHARFAAKARAFLAAGVPVAALCGATWGLAVEGLLDDRDHTSNARGYLAASGYGGTHRFQDAPVVTDGDLITGSGVLPVDFAQAVLAKLDLYEPEVLDSWYKLYGQADAAGYDELMALAQ
jgi:putative intracellular protease/amidase